MARTIGQNIVRMRESRGIKTQGALAKRIGVAQPQVSDWENDRYVALELSTLLRIATAIPCRVDDLLEGVYREYDVANDLARHTDEPQRVPGGPVETPETRLLREQIARYRTETANIHDVVRRLVDILEACDAIAEARTPEGASTGRSARPRETRERSAR